MSGASSPFIEGLIDEEIRRFVAEAIAQTTTLSTSACVAKIKAVYPTCGLSKRYLGEQSTLWPPPQPACQSRLARPPPIATSTPPLVPLRRFAAAGEDVMESGRLSSMEPTAVGTGCQP